MYCVLTVFVHEGQTLEYLEHYVPNHRILKISISEMLIEFNFPLIQILIFQYGKDILRSQQFLQERRHFLQK